MEIGETQLRILSMKAWSLVDKISDEIENENISVCKHCLEHRLLCGIAESPWSEEEKQRLIVIKDSLKDVNNMLVLLQIAVTPTPTMPRSIYLNIKHFQEHESGHLDVIDELNACFGENMEKQSEELKVEDDNSWVFTNCIRGFFNPLNWNRTAKTAIKLALISVSVLSTYKFFQSGQEYKSISSPDSSIARKYDFLAIDSNSPLDVSHGMG